MLNDNQISHEMDVKYYLSFFFMLIIIYGTYQQFLSKNSLYTILYMCIMNNNYQLIYIICDFLFFIYIEQM